MDFHTLTRKELQALCKQNKIPANITNVAMADALKSLDNVEGLDEFLNQSESNTSQSPERSVPESLQIPRTATRTSTQRKPTKEEPESSQPLTRTRRTARRTISEELNQENQDVNIPITPAVPTTRRRAPAASACRIMETQLKESEEDEKLVEQEKSAVFETPAVQTGRKRAPVASSRRKVENQKEEGSVQQLYSTRRSVRLLEKTMADLSLKGKERTEPVMMDALDEVEEKKDDMSGSDFQKISEEVSEKTDDSEICPGQNLNVSLENKEEVKVDVQVINKNDDCEAKPEVGVQNFVNLDSVSVLDVKDEAYDEKTDESDVLLGDYSEKAVEMNDAAIDGKGTEDPSKADNLNDDLEPVTESDVLFNSENSNYDDSDVVNADAIPEAVFNEEESINFDNGMAPYGLEDLKTQKEKYDTEALVDVNVIEAEEFAMTPKSARQISPFCPLVSNSEVSGNIPLPKLQELDNSENLIDIYVMPEVEFVVTTHVHPPMLDNTPTSVKEQLSSDQPLLSGGKVTGGIPLSPMAADSLPGQFPRPTQSTPMKSSSKKQTTIQKLAQVSDINKENIDNTGRKVEPKKDKVKENTINVDNLDGKSLRELTKMLKEKLQITNNAKTNEDKNVTKEPAGTTRPALQTLPENCSDA